MSNLLKVNILLFLLEVALGAIRIRFDGIVAGFPASRTHLTVFVCELEGLYES